MTEPAEHLMDRIAGTAACSSTPGNWQTRESVVAALRQGANAAALGHCMPLAPLLDMEAIVGARKGLGLVGARPSRGPLAQTALAYDDWLVRVCQTALKCLFTRRSGEVRWQPDAQTANGSAEFLHILLGARPGSPHENGCTSLTWLRAYEQILADHERIDQIYEMWCRKRITKEKNWSVWWTAEGADVSTTPTAGSWSVFNQRTGICRDLHERFDHWTAHQFFNADDPRILPDQARRIRRLQRRRQLVFERIMDTPDDQHPFLGALPISVLVQDPLTWVYSDLVDHRKARLNRPPVSRPPRRIHLHLCWHLGYEGLAREQSHLKTWGRNEFDRNAPAPPKTDAGIAHFTCASTLKALSGLMLEDWRNALRKLPVRFHLHRAWVDLFEPDLPDERHIGLGGPGRRWRDLHTAGGLLALATNDGLWVLDPVSGRDARHDDLLGGRIVRRVRTPRRGLHSWQGEDYRWHPLDWPNRRVGARNRGSTTPRVEIEAGHAAMNIAYLDGRLTFTPTDGQEQPAFRSGRFFFDCARRMCGYAGGLYLVVPGRGLVRRELTNPANIVDYWALPPELVSILQSSGNSDGSSTQEGTHAQARWTLESWQDGLRLEVELGEGLVRSAWAFKPEGNGQGTWQQIEVRDRRTAIVESIVWQPTSRRPSEYAPFLVSTPKAAFGRSQRWNLTILSPYKNATYAYPQKRCAQNA